MGLFPGLLPFSLGGTGQVPMAIVLPSTQQAVVGSVVRLDGTASFGSGSSALSYFWQFTKVPIGSQAIKNGFKNLESDGSIVSFAPDITGPYEVRLIVRDGATDSVPSLGQVDVRVILVPHNEGYIPDASFIWNYLSDFWPTVEGKGRLETLWSSAIQLVASELLKLYQYDYNKSIQDIQTLFQRRWLSYPIELPLDKTKVSFILADDQAGQAASSVVIDDKTGTPLPVQPNMTNLVTIPVTEGSFTQATYGGSTKTGRLLQLAGRTFTMLRGGSLSTSKGDGTGGVQVGGTNHFQGATFSSSIVVGDILRVFQATATSYIEYKISVVASNQLNVTTLSGDPVVFSAATGLTWTVLPATASHSLFVADQPRVPGRLSDEFWRFSSTLISTEFNFEQQGVSPGDVLLVEVSRLDSKLTAQLKVLVVSVDRGRLGFVFNLKDLVNGVAAGGLTPNDQLSLAASLQISGLTPQQDGTLVYAGQAANIKTTITSPLFKRAAFETELTPASVIPIGPFSVSLRPISIQRLSKIPIDAKTVSIPVLQEYIKQPKLMTKDGQLFQVSEDKLFPLPRSPYLLIENLNYVIDDEATLRGVCSLSAGSDLISIPFGDLIERGVTEGDSLIVAIGALEEAFSIKHLVDGQTVQVYPTPTLSGSAVQYRLARRVPGKYIRFTAGGLDKTKTLPKRLWAEVIYFDNSTAVEDNFGVLVGVTKEQLDKQYSQIPYKSAVGGLMYALSTGPTVSNLGLAAHVLLGLPFTENAGKITEIDPTYRVRDDGSPLLGRIMVQAFDKQQKSLGLTNIYFYPQGRQVDDPLNPGNWIPANPELSGLAINPRTRKPYAVGDLVSQFTALAKGAEILDYLTSPDWVLKFVRQGDSGAYLSQYHAFELLVNSDIIGAADIDLVAQFIQKAKPAHIKLIVAFQKTLEDQVEVLDHFLITKPYAFFDNVSLGLATAVKFDYPARAPEDFVSVEGQMYALYRSGSDLQTTQASADVSSATGGFVNPPTGSSHDTPFIRQGDLLIIYGGNNSGRYVINGVDDTHLLGLTRLDGGAFNFQTLSNQEFAVYRPMTGVVFSGSAMAVVQGNAVVDCGAGLFSAGVSPGDILTFTSLGVQSRQYTIASVDPATHHITLTSAPVEVSGTYSGIIIRPGLLTRYLLNQTATDFPFQVNLSVGSQQIVFQGVNIPQLIFMKPGDTIIRQAGGIPFTVIDFDPVTLTASVVPTSTVNAVADPVQIQVKDRTTTPISSDILDRVPGESLSLTLNSSAQDLTTTNGSANVTTVSALDFVDLGVIPGDYLVVREGADSLVDIGYGAGIYPIIKVSGGGNVTLTLARTLTQTHAAPGILYGLQRRKVL